MINTIAHNITYYDSQNTCTKNFKHEIVRSYVGYITIYLSSLCWKVIINDKIIEKNIDTYSEVEQLVACRAHYPKVAGSSPALATIYL